MTNTTNTNTEERFYARALDTTTGTLREELGPFGTREEAEQAEAELRERWTLATKFQVRERA